MLEDEEVNNTVGSVVQNSKRRLVEISPETAKTNDIIGNIHTTELMALMTNSLSALLDEKMINLPTKDDLEGVKQHINEVKTEVYMLKVENRELKDEVIKLKESRDADQRRLRQIEEDLGKKKLIVRGLKCQTNIIAAVKKVLREKMELNKEIEIDHANKLFEKDGKMTVMVEMRSAGMVVEVLKRTKKLAGTSIFIDRNLSMERQQDKKIMLELRKSLLLYNKSQKVSVRGDKLVVDGNWFYWNNSKILMCGEKPAGEKLVNIYGEDSVNNLNIDYSQILLKINSKN